MDVKKFETQLLKSQKLEILSNAKEILDSADKNTCEISDGTIRGGISGLLGRKYGAQDGKTKVGQEGIDFDFCAPKLHVSNQAQSLMDMVYQTLDQISPTPSTRDLELLYTSRDLFDLYRAISINPGMMR